MRLRGRRLSDALFFDGQCGAATRDPASRGVLAEDVLLWQCRCRSFEQPCRVPKSGSRVACCRGEAGENAPFWYSFDYGSVHFTIVSSEHSLEPGSEQYRWLVRHLAAVDRCITPWLVVGSHRPLYVIKPHHENRRVGKHLRKSLEDVLVKYGVDALLSGHVHSYSRTCPVIDKTCTPFAAGGVLHVIAGSGGHKLSKIKAEQYGWLAAAEREFGFVRILVRPFPAVVVACCMPLPCLPMLRLPVHFLRLRRGAHALRAPWQF